MSLTDTGGFGTDEALVGLVVWLMILWMVDSILEWGMFNSFAMQMFIIAIAFVSFIGALITED